MKKYVYLLIAPVLFTMASCDNREFVNVNFIGHNGVTCDCLPFAHKGRDLELKLNIPFIDHEEAIWEKEPSADDEGTLDRPPVEYYVDIEDIKVTISGKENRDAWYFYYRHNDDNLLVIKKEYVTDDITIEVSARPFDNLFLYGIVIDDQIWDRWTGREETGAKFTHDVQIEIQTNYQKKPQIIRSLSNTVTFPVLEHDNIDITFRVIDQEHAPLPDDIRFRMNSRYGTMGTDYDRSNTNYYIHDGVSGPQICHINVYHYIVDDHVAFRQFGSE